MRAFCHKTSNETFDVILFRHYVYSMCDVRVGRKTRHTSQLIHMFLEQTIRFTRRFEGTGHQIPFFTRCGDYRGRGNSTFGTFYVELSGLKYRCTSAAECKYSTRMSNFTRRFESMHCVWSFVHDPTTLRDVCVLPQTIDVCVSVLEAKVDTPLS